MDLASLYPYFFEASIKNKALPFIDLFIHKNTNLDYVRDLFNALDSSGDLESRQIAAKETLESLEIVICHDNLCNYAVREINFEPSTLQTIKEVMPQDMFDRLLNKIDKNKLLTSLESDLEMKTSKPKIKI